VRWLVGVSPSARPDRWRRAGLAGAVPACAEAADPP
jgi:hypothetical protein